MGGSTTNQKLIFLTVLVTVSLSKSGSTQKKNTQKWIWTFFENLSKFQKMASFVFYMGVSENSGTPQIIHFNRVFHCKPSIFRNPYFWKHPYVFCSPTKTVSVAFFFAEVTGVLHPVPDEEMPAPPEEKGTVVAGVFFAGRKTQAGWWFHFFWLIFNPIWGRFPFWLIFFRWVETTS